MTYSKDILKVTADAIPRWDRKKEVELTAQVAKLLSGNAFCKVWCASSRSGAGWDFSGRSNVMKTHTGVRDNDLAYGRSFDDEPATVVQYKYDRGPSKRSKRDLKEYCGTSPFLDALSDLVYAGVEFRRLNERSRCHVVSVVHEASVRHREWGKICRDPQVLRWVLECEPKKVSYGNQNLGFVHPEERLIRPATIARVCRIFGTKFQDRDYGLFARAGKLSLSFASQYVQVEEFFIVDWQVLEVEFTGAEAGVTLETWLPQPSWILCEC